VTDLRRARRCGREGWVCEAHPDQPADHVESCGPAIPCPVCNTSEPPRVPAGWLSFVRAALDAPAFPLPVNCPLCGARTTPNATEPGPTYVFVCGVHGRILLGPDGVARQQPQ
jgi:hypothetical protein